MPIALTRQVLNTMTKILNVAEKNDAAKNIANVLSNGSSRKVLIIYYSIYFELI